MFVAPSGSSPQFSKGTYVPVFPTKQRQTTWEGRITNTSDNVVTMAITPAANCIVGKYQMYVAVVTPYGIRRTRKESTRDMYILFNPWVAGVLCCFLFYVYVLESLNCNIPVWLSSYSSTPHVVFPQRMLCSWMMRRRGRSV